MCGSVTMPWPTASGRDRGAAGVAGAWFHGRGSTDLRAGLARLATDPPCPSEEGPEASSTTSPPAPSSRAVLPDQGAAQSAIRPRAWCAVVDSEVRNHDEARGPAGARRAHPRGRRVDQPVPVVAGTVLPSASRPSNVRPDRSHQPSRPISPTTVSTDLRRWPRAGRRVHGWSTVQRRPHREHVRSDRAGQHDQAGVGLKVLA